MTGDDFLSLAEELAQGTTPAHYRSSISRSYYSAYHNAALLLRTIGIVLPGGTECHKTVKWLLDASNDDEVKRLSRELSSLRTARNDADYELDDPKLDKKGRADQEVRVAKGIIEGLKKHMPSGAHSKVHNTLRNHAKNTYGLVVR